MFNKPPAVKQFGLAHDNATLCAGKFDKTPPSTFNLVNNMPPLTLHSHNALLDSPVLQCI
jgi:hypothetical protein